MALGGMVLQVTLEWHPSTPFAAQAPPCGELALTNMMAGSFVGEAEAVVPRVSWQCSLPGQLESSPPLQVGLGLLPVATLFWVWRGSRLLPHGPSHIFGDLVEKSCALWFAGRAEIVSPF